MEAPRFAALGPSLMLAVNCFMPCYTLAYADESQEVSDAPQEEQEEIAGDDRGGLELAPGFGESSADDADGESAREGLVDNFTAAESAKTNIAADNGRITLAESRQGVFPYVASFWGQTWDQLKPWFDIWFGNSNWSSQVTHAQRMQMTATGSVYRILQQQWGYNYGTGNTVLWATNSPAGWLNQTATNTFNTAGRISGLLDRGNVTNERLASVVANTHDTAGRISGLLDRGNVTNEHLAAIELHTSDAKGRISGLLDRGNVTNERLLSIVTNTDATAGRISGLLDRGNVTNDHLSDISTYTYNTAGRISGLLDRGNETNGYLSSVSGILDSVTKGPEGGRVSFYSIGNAVETIKNETRDLDNLLESIDGRVAALDALGVRLANIALTTDEIKKGVNSSLQWYDTLHGDLSMLRHGAADLLPGYADWTVWDFLQGIYFDLGTVVDFLKGLQQTLTAWGNRWDAQDLYLMEWAKRWDALDKSPADLSETNKLLGRLTGDVASIRDKYVVGDTLSDMFGALVGDLRVPATAAAIDGIKGAMSTAFPFCIPSVVNLVLFGSVVADPQAPCWEFDIVGTPLVVDFAGFEDFAEVCRWTVRLLFAAALLLNTRKFVYGVGGAY